MQLLQEKKKYGNTQITKFFFKGETLGNDRQF